jgi:hypothetical protein
MTFTVLVVPLLLPPLPAAADGLTIDRTPVRGESVRQLT